MWLSSGNDPCLHLFEAAKNKAKRKAKGKTVTPGITSWRVQAVHMPQPGNVC